MFTMIGAAVDIPLKVYKHLSTLGPKLYFLRLPRVEHSEDYYLENMKVNFQGKIDDRSCLRCTNTWRFSK